MGLSFNRKQWDNSTSAATQEKRAEPQNRDDEQKPAALSGRSPPDRCPGGRQPQHYWQTCAHHHSRWHSHHAHAADVPASAGRNRRACCACDYLVALGTHPRMSEAQLTRHMGQPVVNGMCGKARVVNHRWDLPETFVDLGTISADTVSEASGGPAVGSDPRQDQSPALRLRPGADLRPGLSPRGGGLFRRKQISVSGRQHRRND